MKRKKRFDFIDFLILMISLLILLAIFSVVLVIAFPNAAKSTLSNIKTYTGPVTSGLPGKVVSNLGRKASDGYNYRLLPLINSVAGWFKGQGSTKEAAKPPGSGVNFSNCIKCHKDLFDQPGFNHVYIDHRLHDARDVACADCHSGSHQKMVGAGIGKVALVPESRCLECHKKGQSTSDCDKCHMPGSLLSVIPKQTTKAFFAARTVNKKVLVPVGFEHPVGDKSAPCRQCHNYPDFCTRCHGMKDANTVRSPHETAKWIPTHGPRILKGELTTNGCWNCHNSNFCSAACHPNPGRQRGIGPKWPLPQVQFRQ